MVSTQQPICRVFRIGVIEIGTGYFRLYNRTVDIVHRITPEHEARWRDWLLRRSSEFGGRSLG